MKTPTKTNLVYKTSFSNQKKTQTAIHEEPLWTFTSLPPAPPPARWRSPRCGPPSSADEPCQAAWPSSAADPRRDEFPSFSPSLLLVWFRPWRCPFFFVGFLAVSFEKLSFLVETALRGIGFGASEGQRRETAHVSCGWKGNYEAKNIKRPCKWLVRGAGFHWVEMKRCPVLPTGCSFEGF